MSRLRAVLTSLLTVFALSLVATAAASADAGQELTTAAVKTAIKDTSGVSVLIAGSNVVTCQKDKSTGKLSSTTQITEIVVTFEECKVLESKKPCEAPINSPGAEKETIVTKKLTGNLGESDETVREESHNVVLVLEPTVAAEGFVTLEETKAAGVKCTPLTKVTGKIAGEVTPTNVSAKEGKLLFELTGTNTQKITKGDIKDAAFTAKLTAFGSPAAEKTEDKTVFEEPLEIKAGV